MSFADHHVTELRKLGSQRCKRANGRVLAFMWNEPGDSDEQDRFTNSPLCAQRAGVARRMEFHRIGAEVEGADRRHVLDADLVHYFSGELGYPCRGRDYSGCVSQYPPRTSAFYPAFALHLFPQQVSAIHVEQIR